MTTKPSSAEHPRLMALASQSINPPIESNKRRFINLNTFAASFLPLIINHFRAFFSDLDTTRDDTTEVEAATTIMTRSKQIPTISQRITSNSHYIAPFIIFMYHLLDSAAILAGHKFHYNSTGMEGLFTHKIYTREFWQTGTVITHLAIGMSTAVFAVLLFRPMLDDKYIIFICHNKTDASVKVIQGGRVWKAKDAKKFLTFRRKGRKYVHSLQVSVYCLAIPYFYFGVITNYKGTVFDFILLAYVPLYVLYVAFGCVFIAFHIMLCAHYMQIQQQVLLKRIETLTTLIRNTKNKKSQSPAIFWRQFTTINSEVLQFFEQLRAVSQFWSPLLTSYFIGHISMEVFFIYALLFSKGQFDWLMRSYFLYFTIELMLLLMAITAACSAIVRYNVKIYKTNVAFCYAFKTKFQLSRHYQTKMDQLIANYKGYAGNGFRLITNYIVDSRMFEAIFFYISTIFLKLCSS